MVGIPTLRKRARSAELSLLEPFHGRPVDPELWRFPALELHPVVLGRANPLRDDGGVIKQGWEAVLCWQGWQRQP
ncbi:hypothetical protein MPNT_30143 [Candidatus Methylacidithermus pantelleriae]|uniref:Uncharacterized protein n=1 Tax=Candidatus Methylacidithermus pantelleriae TaxID=2744239 RepID=A0A8J2BJ73_9BACT|nr:hypothetical protein MPNT_30143 [Candidatus Methylacidithermus pantelleriae]